MPHMPELQSVSGKARYEGGTLHFDVASGTAVGLRTCGRHHRPHRARRAGAAICQRSACRSPDRRRPSSACWRDPSSACRATCSTTTEAARRRGRDRPVARASRCSNALAVADIDIKAEAQVSAFSLKNAIGERRPHRCRGAGQVCRLAAQRHGQRASSTATPSTSAGASSSAPSAPYRQRYELKGTVPANLIAKAGFPSPEPYVTGPDRRTSLHYQVAANGTSELVGRFELKGAKAAAGAARLDQGAGHRRASSRF